MIRHKLQLWYNYLQHPLYIFSKNNACYIFHHLPKCGGTSLNSSLSKWFVVHKDYRIGWSNKYPKKVNLNKMRIMDCISGHFETEGNFLFQRYPEVINNNYKVFTFIRDPLSVQLSLYKYEKKYDKNSLTLEEHLNKHKNYLSNILNVNEENYKKILDRYFFIGILEKNKDSLHILSKLLNKPEIKMKWRNKTSSSNTLKDIDEEIIRKFKDNNTLDYLVYKYCIEKFENMKLLYKD